MHITGENVDIKPLDEGSIDRVKGWYLDYDTYGFATGRKSIGNALNESLNSFAVGVYTKNGVLIGLITGEFKREKETILWIRTFLIDKAWHRKKFGTRAFNLLCKHAAEHMYVKRIYLSVSAENAAGINFWTKMGMTCVKTVETNERENNGKILIFEKVLRP
ncbi:acetyltransferase [Thermoclostridium stercorarium subsp. stercorarium DSM 8532]|nr:GNAT family N-acetyltransferase [Thermoclostridium stercorarium]AGI40033.1 acetyltransferase [Thermoclostridium stercorarium subsp. stercorarium DSM 8532]